MMGLIWKDFYSLRSYFVKQISLLAVMYLGISVFIMDSLTFFAPMMVMSAMMMLISTFSFDESSKWDAYAMTLPLSPRKIVGAKYLLTVGTLFGASAVIAAICCVADAFTYHDGVVVIIGSTFGVAAVYLLAAAIIIPLFYKLGTEKARIVMILCFVLPCMLLVWVVTYLQQTGFDFTVLEQPGVLTLCIAVGVVLLAALCAGSYFLSVKFYSEKEY